MRLKISLLAAAVLFIVALPLFGTSAHVALQAAATMGGQPVSTMSATRMAGVQSKIANCKDVTFLTGLATDLKDLTVIFKAFNPAQPTGISVTLLLISDLRQKYEDMDVTADCDAAAFAMISALANYGDAVALVDAAKADPTNAKAYSDAVGPQIDRANAFLNALITEIKPA